MTIMVQSLLALAVLVALHKEDTLAQTGTPSKPKPELVKQEPMLDSIDYPPQPTISQPGRQVKLVGGIEEKQFAIEWDDWHNKVARAAMALVFNNAVEVFIIPNNATTWIHVEITSDRHIKKVEVLHSSGAILFDRLVREAALKLDGNSVLTFPATSKRTEVVTNFAITKEADRGNRDINRVEFGDVEYQEIENKGR